MNSSLSNISSSRQKGDEPAAVDQKSTAAEPNFVDSTSAWEKFKRLLKPVASLKLTVVLFCLAMFLIFAGTLAQVDKGIWAIMKEYFRTWIAWVDTGIFYPDKWGWGSFKFPVPGGFIVGGLMMINLVSAHLIRFRMTWKRAGIIATHAGIIILLIGELITAVAATEGQIQIEQGRASNYAVNIEKVELAIIDPMDPAGDKVISISENLLQTGAVIQDNRVPFQINILEFYPNSQVVQLWPSQDITRNVMIGLSTLMKEHASDPDPKLQAAIQQARTLVMMGEQANAAVASNNWPKAIEQDQLDAMAAFFKTEPDRDTTEWREHGKSWLIWNAWGGDAARLWIEKINSTVKNLAPDSMLGKAYLIRSLPIGSGVDTEMSADAGSAYIEITNPNPDSPENAVTRHLVSSHLGGSHATNRTADGRIWFTALRFAREYKPYTVQLLEFRHDKYTGSSKAKNFSSKILIYGSDGKLETERPIVISMNQPLRYKGETFFQSSFLRDGGNDAAGTVLQVVRNPGWLLPYIACIVVSLGLLAHFGYMLYRYVRKVVLA